MLVYRVENVRGTGPYRRTRKNKKLADRLSRCHTGCLNHPVAMMLLFLPNDYFCGFDSKIKLQNWFIDFLEELHENKFKLAIYDCPDDEVFVHDEFQILFNRSKAKRISRVSLIQ